MINKQLISLTFSHHDGTVLSKQLSIISQSFLKNMSFSLNSSKMMY